MICAYIMINMDLLGLIVGTCWVLLGIVVLIVRLKYMKLDGGMNWY